MNEATLPKAADAGRLPRLVARAVVVTVPGPPTRIRGMAGKADALSLTALVPVIAGGLLVAAHLRSRQAEAA